MSDRQTSWQAVYTTKAENQVSWFQEKPSLSLELIRRTGATKNSAIVDIGGGASRLADLLLEDGFRSLTVLDLSDAALAATRARIGAHAGTVDWIVADVTEWKPARRYDVWHDRAAFHFLVDASDQAAYVERLRSALKRGGYVIIGTFALDGPEKCSGLPVQRYDAAGLHKVLGNDFTLVEARNQTHVTPWASTQAFQFAVFRRA